MSVAPSPTDVPSITAAKFGWFFAATVAFVLISHGCHRHDEDHEPNAVPPNHTAESR